MNSFITEIESAFSALPKRTSSQHPETYIGGGQSKLRYIGLRGPQLAQVLKGGFSFSNQSPEEVGKVWHQVWSNSDCFEVMALALSWYYDPRQRPLLERHWPHLKKWSLKIDNWAHSDVLSGIYARILESNPALVYPTSVQWNRAKNPWLRRLSMVSLLYYSSQREKVPPVAKILNLVKPQLSFDHYYVQKGVGWTLRETGNVYPIQTFKFLEKNIARLSPYAFSAATEKMGKNQKEYLKRLRRPKK